MKLEELIQRLRTEAETSIADDGKHTEGGIVCGKLMVIEPETILALCECVEKLQEAAMDNYVLYATVMALHDNELDKQTRDHMKDCFNCDKICENL